MKALDYNVLKARWFQAIGFKCQPAPPYNKADFKKMEIVGQFNLVGGGAKLDPGLKAPLVSKVKSFNLMKIKLAFNLNPGFLSLHPPTTWGSSWPPSVRRRRNLDPGLKAPPGFKV